MVSQLINSVPELTCHTQNINSEVVIDIIAATPNVAFTFAWDCVSGHGTNIS